MPNTPGQDDRVHVIKAAPIRCVGAIDSLGIKMASYPLKAPSHSGFNLLLYDVDDSSGKRNRVHSLQRARNRSSMLCVLGIVTLTQLWPMVIKRRSDGLSSSKLFMSLMNIYVLIQVGSALKKVIPSVVKREELFIVTKVNHSFDSHYIDVRTLTHCTYSFGTHFTTPKMSNQTLTSRSSNSG